MNDLRFTTSSSVFQSYQEVGMAIVQGLIESVNRKRCGEETEKVLPVSTNGKSVLQISYNNKTS